MSELQSSRRLRCPCGNSHQPVQSNDPRPIRILARDKHGEKLSIVSDKAELKDSRIEIEFVQRGESGRAMYVCELHYSTDVMRRAMRFAILQSAFRRGLQSVNVRESSSKGEFDDDPFINETRIVDVESQAKLMFQEGEGFEPFHQWLKVSPDDWKVCMLLSNAYWTRSQVRTLASPQFREMTKGLVLGRYKPDFPSFPELLLDVEFMGYWELAGCLVSIFGLNLAAAEVCIGNSNEINLSYEKKSVLISHLGQSRFPPHLLRSSIKRRLQGTVSSS